MSNWNYGRNCPQFQLDYVRCMVINGIVLTNKQRLHPDVFAKLRMSTARYGLAAPKTPMRTAKISMCSR